MDARAAYQVRRRALLASLIELDASTGLEIGACDLPTASPDKGSCSFADFRSASEMVEMWNLPTEAVVPVTYLLSRDRSLPEQIKEKFDYIIACHVLEHIPDIIAYLLDLHALLKPGPGRVVFMTLPDKRATLDATRPSTKLERIVANYHNRVRVPQLDEVMEFHRHWVGFANGGAPLPIREAYEYASQAIIDKDVDAHCHVWEDQQFKSQIEQLIEGGFLQSYRLALFEPYFLGTNEFAVGLVSI